MNEPASAAAPARVQIIRDWRWVLRYGWSVRWLAIAALLQGVEIACSVITAMYAEPPLGIPRGIFTAFASLATVAAFIARFIAQKRHGAE